MNRILVLAHREELIYQAVGHARAAGLTAGMEMGSHRARREPVVVSTVQTMTARGKCRWCSGAGCELCTDGRTLRMERFDPFEFECVIVDEGHHATAKSYRRVLEHFQQNPNLKVLLVTATPQRSDKVGLHNVCESVAYEMDLRTAIDEGWLCPIRQRFVTVDSLDLSKVSTKAGGDLADGELERAFLGNGDAEEEEILHKIAKPTIDQAAGQPGIVFAAGCEHATKLTAAFNAYDGVTAELVLGTTDKEDRRGIVKRFKDGQTQFLINVGVATEGFDAPAASVVAVARPTKSASLYLQMIGRGTRPLPGIVDGPQSADLRRIAIAESRKPVCVVLDFVGNSGRHKLISVVDVLAGSAVDPLDIQAAVKAAKKSGEAVDVDALIEKVKQAREAKEKRREERAKQRESTHHRAEQASYTATDVDIFNGRPFNPYVDYKPKADGATPGQVYALIKQGIGRDAACDMSKRQAGAVLNKLKKGRNKSTNSDYVLTFGGHRGKKLSEVPESYIQMLLRSNKADEIRPHINH